MDGKRTSVPLYLHITLLSFGLVLATGLVLRWFGDAIPGVVEFGLLLGAVAVVALLASRRIAAPLAALAKEAEAVRHFDFSDHPVIRSPVQEIDQLAGAFDLMRDAVRRFLRINRRLATEDDLEALQPWLLDKMVDIAGARAGVLYRRRHRRQEPLHRRPLPAACRCSPRCWPAPPATRHRRPLRRPLPASLGRRQWEDAAHRGLAARLRQGHHARVRGRQGDQAGDPLRPHPRDPHALRGAQARCRDRLLAKAIVAARRPRRRARCGCARQRSLATLDDEFAFVAACNAGGEAMAPADVARLRRSPRARWLRTLDDRLGVSREELRARARPSPLPVEERCWPTSRNTSSSPGRKRGPHRPRQPAGASAWTCRSCCTTAASCTTWRSPRHAHRGGALQDQRAHRADHRDARRAAVPAAPAGGAGDRRRPPREDGRQRLPQTPDRATR
jgi:HAMP domain-containing protein